MVGLSACKKNHAAAPDKPVDVYIAGIIQPSAGKPTACYWKNGSMVQLPTNDTASWAYSIAVSGKDVYVAGAVRTAAGPAPSSSPVTMSMLRASVPAARLTGKTGTSSICPFCAAAKYRDYQLAAMIYT